MRTVLVSLFTFFAVVTANAQAVDAFRTRPASAIAEDVRAQDNGDWSAFLALRADAEGTPEDAANYAALWGEGGYDLRANVRSARLEGVTAIPFDVARRIIGESCYFDHLRSPQAFYGIVDYGVAAENKFIVNGPNARLWIIDYTNGVWQILQVSEPPIGALIANGYGLGSPAERDLLNRQKTRVATGRFLNGQGETVYSATLPDSVNLADPQPSPLSIIDHTLPASIIVAHAATFAQGCTLLSVTGCVDFMTYVKNVLPNEWAPPSSFPSEALKAGAIAVKMYGWYHKYFAKYSNQGFDVKDTDCDQVYRANTAVTSTNNAFSAVSGIGMDRSDGALFEAHYEATGSGTGFHLGWMYQLGTVTLANSGYTYQDMAHYYWDNSPSTGTSYTAHFFSYTEGATGCSSGLSASVTSPVGGETWQTLTTHNVTWNVTGGTAGVSYWKVALSTDGGATWPPSTGTDSRQISGAIFDPNARSFSWTVENIWNTTQARIRVRALDSNSNILAEAISPANFTITPVINYTLTVNGTGTGQGSVTGNGINCTINNGSKSGTCSAQVSSGSPVSLSASPSGGSTFDGWTGSCIGGGCSFTMNGNNDVTASFTAPVLSYVLTVNGTGTGQGTVSGSGINCSINAGSKTGTCSMTINAGTPLSLAASAASGSTFNGWTGPCNNSGGCSFNMPAANTTVSAAFSTSPPATGTINVNATLNGVSWSGPVSYQVISGPTTLPGSSVPATFNNAAGASTYSISYTSGGPGGTPTIANSTQFLPSGGSITFTLAFSGQNAPNLVIYQPGAWPDKIVTSKTTGNSVNDTVFAATDTIYVDFDIGNFGNVSISSVFYVDLIVDGAITRFEADPPWDPNGVGGVIDWPIGPLARGRHTITVNVDSTSAISESNESDNQYSKTIVVGRTEHDYDADGKSDLIWRNAGTGDTVMWLMGATGYTTSKYLINLPAAWSIAASGDFDGDGKSDLIWRNTAGDTVMWLMNGGSYTSSIYLINLPVTWSIAATGDFNGDGKTDLIWRNATTGDTVLWLMNGGTSTSSPYLINLPAAWTIVATADFDGDGKSDLIWRNAGTGDTVMWLMNGSTYSSSTYMINLPAAWSIATTGDFDGDGKTDLVWRNATGDTVVWLMNGATYTSSTYLINLPSSWTILSNGDFDGDGKSDLIWRNATTGDTVMWLMNGGTYTTSRYLINLPSAWTITPKS